MKPPIVLVVDDNDPFAHILVQRLEAAGYVATSSRNALDALRLARELRPDLILMDVNLPGMSGSLLSELMHEDIALRDMPVILMSAISEESLERKRIEARAVDAIAKPFRMAALLDRLEMWLAVRN